MERDGVGDDRETAVARAVADLLARRPAAEAWSLASRTLLRPDDRFALHAAAYEQCYGADSLRGGPPGPAWLPDPETVAHAHVTHAARELGLADYPAFHRWSVEHRAEYWELAIRRLGLRFRRPYDRLLDASEPTRPHWLVGASMNIVESCFAAEPGSPAILYDDGGGRIETTSVEALHRLAGRVANALREGGIRPGDAVAVVLPMSPRAVALYLGIVAAGAVVVSIADSFAAAEIARRLRIADARLVVTQYDLPRGGRRLPLYDRVAEAAESRTVVVLHEEARSPARLRAGDRTWDAFLSADERLEPVPRAPADPINVLFSSGTTGDPKAIPWDHTTPIKAAADAHFHQDVHPGDVVCWPTTLGWMMGPWLIFGALLNRATLALYAETPLEAGFGRFVETAGVTMLGLVPSMVRAWRASGCMLGRNWSALRVFSSTGECSNATDMLYLMHLAGYRPVIEYCGGTELGGGYITGTVVQPCVPAAFTTPTLGLEFEIRGDDHRPAPTGELFLRGPSIGFSTRLLNRDHHAAYYDGVPATADGAPLRRHGDEVETLPGGYYRVQGRCDDTMNLGGIKVACAEIERVVNQVEGVLETAAVAAPEAGGGPSRLVVFAVPRPGSERSAAELQGAMQAAVRQRLNPLFHVAEVRLVAALPRTASNKVMRRELRAELAGAGEPDPKGAERG
jgi:acetyl-CoA synthetase